MLLSAGGPGAADPSPPGAIEFVGKNAFATADGTFHAWRVVDRSIDSADPARSWAVVEIDLASVDTGIARRDDHLRDPDFFEVETWPTARVRAHSLAPAGADEENRPRFTAKFDVDLHGVQSTIEGEVVLVEESPATFEGTLVVDRMTFGVGPRPSRWNPMSIDAEIPVQFRVAFQGATHSRTGSASPGDGRASGFRERSRQPSVFATARPARLASRRAGSKSQATPTPAR